MKRKWLLLLVCLIFSCVDCFSNTDAEDTWIKVSSLSKIQGQWEGYVLLKEELGMKAGFFMFFDIRKYTFDMSSTIQLDFTEYVYNTVEELNGSFTNEQIWEYCRDLYKQQFEEEYVFSDEPPYIATKSTSYKDATYSIYFNNKDLYVNKAGTKIKFIAESEAYKKYGDKLEVVLDKIDESKKK